MEYKFFPMPYAGDFGGTNMWVNQCKKKEFERKQKIVRENYRLYCCKKCGNSLDYLGLGEYQCLKCGERYLDAVGKVNKAIEEGGGCSIDVLAKNTGLSINVIRNLIEDGYLSVI